MHSHADTVAQHRPARERGGRVDSDDANGLAFGAVGTDELVDEC
ncbi:hypothetical protein SDC9_168672 [bioreactor metagenome]|uniref:Uncharacterized protein n=1 Tax=bioreactor metagenome TaxID=1076179 RepID=A0A645GBN9_9ZZZZ